MFKHEKEHYGQAWTNFKFRVFGGYYDRELKYAFVFSSIFVSLCFTWAMVQFGYMG